MVFILGLTGGIGSGKSAASSHFETLGITVVDSDIVAREVVASGSSALRKISLHFGGNILLPTGELDRSQLRQRIFSNPEEKQWLEELLHPIIRKETIKQLSDIDSPYGILSSPLLFESNQHELTNRTLIIDCEEELQISRAQLRDSTNTDHIKKIISTQLPRTERNKQAEDIIENNSSLTELHHKVENYHNMILTNLHKGLQKD